MSIYKEPNIYRPDDGQGFQFTQRSQHDIVQLRCPHCLSMGSFLPASETTIEYFKAFRGAKASRGDSISAQMRVCPNLQCQGLVFTLTKNRRENLIHPPELLHFEGENIPNVLLATLKEAISCHSVGAYRASAMIVRRLLEEICENAGVSGRTLHDRLKALRAAITLPEELFDAMDELKALGNDAAHIEAKAYQSIDREEVELSIELAQEILRARFQHQGLLARLKARRNSDV